MNRRLLWLVAPIVMTALVACDPTTEDTNGSAGGTATTTEGVEISLGTGSGGNFNEGIMSASVGAASLSAGGTTTVSVNIVDVSSDNALYSGTPVEVEFDSQCAASGKATFSNPSVLTSTGIASTTYQAEGCYGDDTISAKYTTATAAVTISVSPADVNSIGFSALSASSIAYGNSSTEAQPNLSVVVFLLQDARGNPVEGQTVSFEISSTDTNNGVALSNSSDISDSEGLVETRVNAGTAAANLRVVATFSPSVGSAIATQSPAIAVNTGPADWDSFIVGPDTCAVAKAYNIFNLTAQITAVAADRHNNPVADGTEISFWTESGRIEPSCQTTSGSCSATWWSGGGTTLDEGGALGLSTIVAYTVGEDSFVELTMKNGLYDVGETIIAAPEMFHDYDFDLAYDAGQDTYVDYDNSGTYDASNGGIYRGGLCSATALAAGHCGEESVLVWDSTRITRSTTFMALTPSDSGNWDVTTAAGGAQTFSVAVSDLNGNLPPAGTTLTATSDTVDIEVLNGASPNYCPGGPGSHQFFVRVKPKAADGASSPVKLSVSAGGEVTLDYSATATDDD